MMLNNGYFSVQVVYQISSPSPFCFYNNAAKIFSAEVVLCRRLKNVVVNMVDKTSGRCYISTTSRLCDILEKS